MIASIVDGKAQGKDAADGPGGETNSKYQYMEANQQRRVGGLKGKIPDLQKTLDTVQFLQTRKDEPEPMETTFEVNDTLYARAEIPPTEEVSIWLGVGIS